MAPATNSVVLEAIAARIVGSDRGGIILPFFIGSYLDSLLLGFSIVQMFKYRVFLRRDKSHIVILLILAFASTLASSILLLWMISLFCTNFGLYLPFASTTWLCRHMASEIVCTLVVQASYIDRACRLWKSYWPAIALAPFSLATTVLGCLCLNNFTQTEIFVPGNHDYMTNALMYSLFGMVITSDILITAVLAWGLYRQKSGWKQTDSLLKRLIFRCCETQFFALISALVIMVAWSKAYGIAICILLFQTKIYYLGLQITLNSRISTAKSLVKVSHPSSGVYTAKGSILPRPSTQLGYTKQGIPQMDDHTQSVNSAQDLEPLADVARHAGERDRFGSTASLAQIESRI